MSNADESINGNDNSPAEQSPTTLKEKVLSAFPAFRSRNFRLYFIGQIVSMVGTWLQMVAQGWLVLEMTGSAFWVGVAAAASSLPTLFLSLIGGVIVDRYNRKTILLWTQSASMVLALVLGIITLTGSVTLAVILALAFLLGCVAAVATPAIQAFLSEMVDRDQLHSAVALNAAIFNASRVIGPAIAGLMIAWIGTGGAFIANGLSYFAVIAALLAITIATPRKIPAVHQPPLQSIRDGIVYTWEHPVIRTIVMFVSVVSIFGWSFMSMLPVVAKQTYGLGSDGMGYLFSAFGLGSLSGTVVVSMSSGKIRSSAMVIGGILVFSLALTAFTFASDERVAMAFLFIAGIGMLSAFATMTATVQRLVEDSYRGRVMSIYLMVLMGFMPLGNLQVGFLSEQFGTAIAIRIGSIVVLLATIFLFSYRKEIQSAWHEYRMQE
ncbi:MFS transporter [Chlorobium phaeobacteroides]|jgi:MFS family permease|uniref:Major facilitator superfamily MFS_1 n=1 Tax=Chlorobium phaeobacteroides (strain DSM 266 / SMG 266 / 2430) TaxID=290317 RepID=A1BCN0_CHLPD|nr:MFS transporter [Chlorobium phaeobacteroides]ABL64157.1 major facilitator superfamily MFS_1 [Chlorobium phaeobacteroides DSM 266]MBV5328825.1 MFS transporter [Chlorobium sp.]